VTLQDYLDEQMKDPAFRKAYEAAEPAYQRERRRIVRRLEHNTSDVDCDLRTSGEIALVSVVGCVVMCLGLAGAVWTIVQLVRWLAG